MKATIGHKLAGFAESRGIISHPNMAPLPLIADYINWELEGSSLPSKNFPCISMDMLQIGALMLLGRLVEAGRIYMSVMERSIQV